MNSTRHTSFELLLNKRDLIEATKKMFPYDIVAQAVPESGDGVEIEKLDSGAVKLRWKKAFTWDEQRNEQQRLRLTHQGGE